jgi:hypothetical protein
VCSQVPLPHRCQPLFTHNGQRLTHRVEGADNAGVVVAALRLEPAPVVCRGSSRGRLLYEAADEMRPVLKCKDCSSCNRLSSNAGFHAREQHANAWRRAKQHPILLHSCHESHPPAMRLRSRLYVAGFVLRPFSLSTAR